MSRESNEPRFKSSSAERKLRKQRSKTLSSSVKGGLEPTWHRIEIKAQPTLPPNATLKIVKYTTPLFPPKRHKHMKEHMQVMNP
eukprot:3572709-Amphidinium_carterae.1